MNSTSAIKSRLPTCNVELVSRCLTLVRQWNQRREKQRPRERVEEKI